MFLWHSKRYNVPNISEERKNILKVHAKLKSIPISDYNLWNIALTHISCSDKDDRYSYERLEFLGDAVLALCISDILFVEYSELSEGKMSMLRSSLVNEKTLSVLGRDLDLLSVVKLGQGERLSDKRAQEKVLCDLFESTLAVIFLSSGLKNCREFVKVLLTPKINSILVEGDGDFKTKLQKISIKVYKEYPVYNIVDTEGPDHGRIFTVQGIVSSFNAIAKGRSKKEAEQNVAKLILDSMHSHCLNNPDSILVKEINNG